MIGHSDRHWNRIVSYMWVILMVVLWDRHLGVKTLRNLGKTELLNRIDTKLLGSRDSSAFYPACSIMEAFPIQHFNTTLKGLGLCSILPWFVACIWSKQKGENWRQLLLVLGKPNPKPGINIFWYTVSEALVLSILWWATKVQAALNFLCIFLFIQRFLKLCAWGQYCIFKRTYNMTWNVFKIHIFKYIFKFRIVKSFSASLFFSGDIPLYSDCFLQCQYSVIKKHYGYSRQRNAYKLLVLTTQYKHLLNYSGSDKPSIVAELCLHRTWPFHIQLGSQAWNFDRTINQCRAKPDTLNPEPAFLWLSCWAFVNFCVYSNNIRILFAYQSTSQCPSSS